MTNPIKTLRQKLFRKSLAAQRKRLVRLDAMVWAAGSELAKTITLLDKEEAKHPDDEEFLQHLTFVMHNIAIVGRQTQELADPYREACLIPTFHQVRIKY